MLNPLVAGARHSPKHFICKRVTGTLKVIPPELAINQPEGANGEPGSSIGGEVISFHRRVLHLGAAPGVGLRGLLTRQVQGKRKV